MPTSHKLIILVVIGLVITCCSADECQVSSDSICECTYKDGTGFSLKKLLSANDEYIEAFTNQNLTYFWNPCKDTVKLPVIANATNHCDKGYMLCVYDSRTNNYTLLGSKQDAAFGQKDGKIFMNFGKLSENHSTIHLECTPDASEDSSVLYAPKESTITDVHLVLFSKLSCMQQIYEVKEPGFFSTFFLVLFIMFFCYLVIGMLYQYFLVGARGFEILPNYDFWCKIWISIKLGFLYLKNGCKVIPLEDSYDAI